MAVQDIDISYAIWCKNIEDLKGMTTWKKPIHGAEDIIKIPKALIKICKDVYMIADILFVNVIPFLFLWIAI